jgi:hypothetical protein
MMTAAGLIKYAQTEAAEQLLENDKATIRVTFYPHLNIMIM